MFSWPLSRVMLTGLLTGLAVLSSVTPASAHPDWHKESLSTTPRIQWNANDGYCGETSMITAGLRLGQYTSQWTARSMASPGVPQTQPDSQLLLGVNDVAAANAMGLQAERAPLTRNYRQFLTWVIRHMAAGDTVIIGVLNNTTELREPGPGDPAYDHIVPVYAVESRDPITRRSVSHPNDLITISDNGLRTLGPNYPMLYSYRVGDFRATRAQANAPGGPTYSLVSGGPWYGLAVTGVTDPNQVTVPVTVSPSSRSEGVQNQPALTAPPTARNQTLTVTVNRPAGSGPVTLYEYADFATAATGTDFTAGAVKQWKVPAGSGPWAVTVDASTADTRVFRAVRAG